MINLGIRLSAQGGAQAQAEVTRLGQAVDQFGAAARGATPAGAAMSAQHHAMAGSARLNANQTAQLSAQLQDLFVQIQAGGSPMTALIQQGSQLSAVFGGFGPALKAVGSLITPSVAAMGAAAAGGAAVALAYKQGAEEGDAFARAVILSGNASGTTTSRMKAMAAAQDEVTDTHAKAAAVIADLADSGKVAEAQIAALTDAAVRMDAAGGPAVDSLVKKFEALGESPLRALVKLNEAENFLTRAVYDQVRALEQQGKTAEAAAVAQEAYAQAVKTRAAELEGRLGLLERAWLAVKTGAAEAWDAMLGIGREDTLGEKLAAAEKELAAKAARGPTNDRPEVIASHEKGLKVLRATVETLRAQVYAEQEAATAQKASAEAVKTYVAAQDEAERKRKQAADDARRFAEAGRELAMSLQLEAAGLSGDFLDKWNSLNAAYSSGALSVTQLDAAHRRLLDSQPAMSAMAKAEEDARARALAALGDQVKARDAELASLAAGGRALADQVAQQQAGNLAARTGIDYSGQLAVAKLREAAVTAELAAIKAEEKNLDFALGEQYRKNAAELRALADAKDAAMAGAISSNAQKSIEDFLDPSKAESFGDALRGAFDGAASSLAKLSEVMGDYSRKQAAIAAERAKLDKVADPVKRQQLEMKLNERAADQQIQNYAQIAGAAKGFFAEGSKGYKTLQVAEQAFQAYQLASDLIRGTSAAAVAVAHQATGGDVWSAIPRMAAMAGIMGTLGFAVAGGFNKGGSAPSAADRQEANGTGTVLGDAKAKSESIARSLDALEDSARIELETQSGMLRALRNIEASLAGLGNLVVRSNGITTGNNFGIKTGTLSVNEGDPLAKALGLGGLDKFIGSTSKLFGAVGGALHGLWGKVKQDVTDAGLSIGGRVSDLAGGRGVQQYADVTRTESSWFGLKKDTSTSTQFGEVSGDLAAQFGMVFENMGDVLKGAAGELGRDGEAVAQQIAQFVVDIPRLSLKGLSGEEVQEAISNAISASADLAAKASVAGLDDFQRIGEGYFEAVVRVAAGVESASYELEQLGVAAVSFSSIANKQGDIAAEIVRQSIVAVETAGGALSNVGQIISTFDGDAAEVADTFEALVDVRQALQLVGMSGDALSVALIRAAGGLDELASLVDGYHEDFYTAEERRAATLSQVRAGLAELGEVLPDTRDGFRAIVERIGTKGDAGALAAVLRLADAFASVTPSADELARAASDAAKDAADVAEKAAKDRIKAAEDAADAARKAADTAAAAQARARKAFDSIAADMVAGVADAFNEVRSQIEAETDRINDEAQKQADALDKRADDVRSAFEKVADAMGDLRESLQQTIDEISGELAGDEGRAQARERLSAMLATAQAGGALDPDAVKQAVSVAARLSTDGFSTKADYLRDAAQLQGTLRGLSAEAGRQTEAAQAAMNAELKGIAEEVAGVKGKADAQIKILRQQLDEARTAAGMLASIDDGVQSVAGAIAALTGAIAATKAVSSADDAVTGRWQQSGGGEVYRDANGAVGVRKTGDTDAAGLQIRGKLTSFNAQEAIDWIDAQVMAGNARAVYDRARAEGLSLSTVDELMAGKGWKPGTSTQWAAANSLPAFADGGDHAGGFRIVGERGPEIEATGPSRIHTFDQLMAMAGAGRRDESLAAEVRKLRAEVERMHANLATQQLAIATHTSKAASIFKRWEGGGMPPERT